MRAEQGCEISTASSWQGSCRWLTAPPLPPPPSWCGEGPALPSRCGAGEKTSGPAPDSAQWAQSTHTAQHARVCPLAGICVKQGRGWERVHAGLARGSSALAAAAVERGHNLRQVSPFPNISTTPVKDCIAIVAVAPNIITNTKISSQLTPIPPRSCPLVKGPADGAMDVGRVLGAAAQASGPRLAAVQSMRLSEASFRLTEGCRQTSKSSSHQ